MSEEEILSKKKSLFILTIVIIISLLGLILIVLGFNMTFCEYFYGNDVTYIIFSAISYLGWEIGLILLVVTVYLVYDKKFGKNLIFSLIASFYSNSILKDIFQDPLPWTRLDQRGFSFPSGHAQNAVATWGFMAYEADKKENKIFPWIFLIIIYLISISRIIIGEHDVDDVVGGLLFGISLSLIFIHIEPIISEKVNRLNLNLKIILAIAIPIILFIIGIGIFPNTDNHYGYVGALIGLSIGYLIENEKIKYNPSELEIKQRIINLAIGIVIVLVVYLALDLIPLDLGPLGNQIWEFFQLLIVALIAILLIPWLLIIIQEKLDKREKVEKVKKTESVE